MTADPKIAALEQAERDAYHAYTAANRAWAEAREDLRKAQLEATGLAGHIVSTKQRWGYGTNRKTREFKFIVDAHNGTRVSGRIVKADGTLGSQRKDATLDNVTDLGPFKPAA